MTPVIPSSYVPDTSVALVFIQELSETINVRYSSTISPQEIERYFNGEVLAIYDGSGQFVIWSTLSRQPLPEETIPVTTAQTEAVPDTNTSPAAALQPTWKNPTICPTETTEDDCDIPQGVHPNIPTVTESKLRRCVLGAGDTINRIRNNGPFPFERDNIPFRNDQSRLPLIGYPQGYREYTLVPDGAVVRGQSGMVVLFPQRHSPTTYEVEELYYSEVHYEEFAKVVQHV